MQVEKVPKKNEDMCQGLKKKMKAFWTPMTDIFGFQSHLMPKVLN